METYQAYMNRNANSTVTNIHFVIANITFISLEHHVRLAFKRTKKSRHEAVCRVPYSTPDHRAFYTLFLQKIHIIVFNNPLSD